MTPSAEEARRFLRLAEGDRSAFELLRTADHIDFSVAGFHAQQAVEKGLKAVMCVLGLPLIRTHDLEELAGRLHDAQAPVLPCGVDELRRLTPFAVALRYGLDAPLDLISPDDAARVVADTLAWAAGIVADGGPARWGAPPQ